MSRPRLLTPLLLLAVVACGSDGPQRSHVPDRPQVQRPDGLEPDGVVEMRETLAGQRADSRAAMDAALIQSNELETDEGSWLDGLWNGVLNLLP